MPTSPKPKSDIDLALTTAFLELKTHPPTSSEYATVMDQIVKLNKMKNDNSSPCLSPDTLALAATNLLGLLMVIRHENVNVIATKAFSMVLKPR